MFSQVTEEIVGRTTTYPARLVTKILTSEEYMKEWLAELKETTGRLKAVRKQLRDRLVELKTPGNWDFIVKQKGLFTYLGLARKE